MCSTLSFEEYIQNEEYKDAINNIVFGNSHIFDDNDTLHVRYSCMHLEHVNVSANIPNEISKIHYIGKVINGITIPRVIDEGIIFVISKSSRTFKVVTNSEIFKSDILSSYNYGDTEKCNISHITEIIIKQLQYNLKSIKELTRLMYKIKMEIQDTTIYTTASVFKIVDGINQVIWLYENMLDNTHKTIEQLNNTHFNIYAEGQYSNVIKLLTDCKTSLHGLSNDTFFVAESITMRASIYDNVAGRALTIVTLLFLPASFIIHYTSFYEENINYAYKRIALSLLIVLIIIIMAYFKEDFIMFLKG